jgi:glucose-6-phosphate dehydrogenase assembly protein OpcA
VTEADGQGIDADITLHEAESEGVSLWSEDVVLTVRGTASRHLCSLIEPLTLSDLPVVVWYVASLPPPGDQLVAGATAIVVDSKELGDQRAFADLRALMRQRTLVDLSWVRLRTPRQLLAGLFDGRDYRPFVAGVTSAQVAGKAGPRHLLGGWIVDCLGLPRAEVHLTDARHISLHLVADAGGHRGTFSVDREEGTRNVRARATIDAGPSHDDVLTLSEGGLGWALGEALTDLEPDVAYLRALQAALGFLG